MGKKDAMERAMKEVVENATCDAVEKANKQMEAKTKTNAQNNANQNILDKTRKELEVKQIEGEVNQEKSLCELQHKEAQKECDDQASTRASSPDPKGQSNSICELPRFGTSKLETLLHKFQDAHVTGPQAQGASQMPHSEIAQLVSEIVAEHNRIMPGWEIPVRPHVKVEEGASR